MKLSDYIAQFLVEQNVKTVFAFSGGAAAHLIDSIDKNEHINYICPQHEEHVAMAADGYARVTQNIGVGMVTSGPGATNTLTGICSSFFDSIPTLLISGQVSSFRVRKTPKLRQYGFQETDVISIFKSVTKYAKLLDSPNDIKYVLQEAIYYAKEGRPGPVLVDIPDDFQRVDIEPSTLKEFIPPKKEIIKGLKKEIIKLKELISQSKKPLFIFGAGVSISYSKQLVTDLTNKLNIPFLLTWGAKDIFPDDNPLNFNGFGASGPRYGNIAIQNADLIIGVGTKFSQLQTGGKLEEFAYKAKKVLIDIDIEEINKFQDRELNFDLEIHSNLKDICSILLNESVSQQDYTLWLEYLTDLKKSYPICPKKLYNSNDVVNPYVFINSLSEEANNDAILVADTGANLTWTMQTFKTKKDQQIFSAWNHTPMGYSLAGAIGAAFANPNRQIICLIGDGGLQMCIEELATVARHNLPIKIFLFNNHGHGIIKQTIDTWLDSNYNAIDEDSGLSFPDFNAVAEAYKLKTRTLNNHKNINKFIKNILEEKGPIFCNVEIFKNQQILPQLVFGKSIDNMYPYIKGKNNE